MEAVAGEVIKGFHIAHEACRILRETRSDFELVVTFDPPGAIEEFTRYVGWCSQDELPGHLPGLLISAWCLPLLRMRLEHHVGRSDGGGQTCRGQPDRWVAVYGGSDGLTGLLFEPGNPRDLAEKIAAAAGRSRGLRGEMGLAGRRRFEDEFRWDDVIKRYWRPLACRLG